MTLAGIALPLLFYSGLSYADYRSTEAGLQRGGRELNPLVGAIGEIPTRVVSVGLMTLGDLSLREHKRARWVYRGALGALYAGVVIHNRRIKR